MSTSPLSQCPTNVSITHLKIIGRTADLTIKVFVAAYLYLGTHLVEVGPLSRKRRQPVKVPNHDRGGKTQQTNQKSTGTEGIQLAQPTPLPVPAPNDPPKGRWAIGKAEKIATRIKIDGYLVQPMEQTIHGAETGWANWNCQCPLCRLAHIWWETDRKKGVLTGDRRGSPRNLVMVAPELITEGLLDFYANCRTDRIPHEILAMIKERQNQDTSNGHHEETQIDMTSEPLVPPETDTTEAIPAPPEQDDDDDEYNINPSKCVTIKHRNGSAIYTMRSGAVVTITPPKL